MAKVQSCKAGCRVVSCPVSQTTACRAARHAALPSKHTKAILILFIFHKAFPSRIGISKNIIKRASMVQVVHCDAL